MMPAQKTHISGMKRLNITRITSARVCLSSSPAATLIIILDTAIIPVGIAQNILITKSEVAKAEMATVPI